jgi:murein DD-endopeptidase MepM/ murein hydrolase activator NlpD
MAIVPAPPTVSIIGRPYQGTHELGNWQSDNAYDLATPVGTPMTAAASGVVISVTRHAQDGSRFAGDGITIRTDDGNQLFYKHGVATVKQGQRVQAGDVLGTTGSANGSPHLHFAALSSPQRYLSETLGDKSLIDKVGGAAGTIKDKVTGAASDVATAAAKGAVGALWGAVGEDGARALLYALFVFGGVALAVVGIARATGVGQAAKTAAGTGAQLGLTAATKGAL